MHQLCRIVLLSSLAVGRFAQADVVFSNAVNSSSSVAVLVNNSRGQTFTNTGPTAAIQSVTVYLKNSSGATGNIGIGIRTITGTPGVDAVYVATAQGLVASSATISAATISNTVTAVTFSTFSGSNTTLTTGTSYAFVLNVANLSGSLDMYYGSPISGQNSIATANNSADTSNDLAGQVVTVPEPGTLTLGGMAAAFGGLFYRRKKKLAGTT
ncbi:MAG: PEP-CTERM sorting domain-containing protein [Gemmataceae bacterium]